MAQIQNPRRFYIDHGDDQPIVRAVPVRRAGQSLPAPEPIESVATHQVPQPTAFESSPLTLRTIAKQAPRSVSRLVQSARKRSHSQHS